jgi:diacylglycerol kinase family enzyme
MDLGRAGPRHFLLMAGIGFDAAIVNAVPSRPKRLLGSTSYALWGARELLRYRPRRVDLLIDGSPRSARLYWLLLGNTRSYGGVATITSEAFADDGLLDAYVFEGAGAAWLAATAARLAAGRQDGGRGITFQRLGSLEVLTPGLPVQVDGEYIGETPMHFTVSPAAIDVLLPPDKADVLFGVKPE